MYSVTYFPVLMDMADCSPDEQMLYQHSSPEYVVPPQQYSIYPEGFSSCYPEPTMPEYGIPYYTDQGIYDQSPFTMVPPLQQPLLARREKKVIRIRDPKQGGRDVTEEIMLEVGWSRNPTPPMCRSSFIPTPPLQLNHVMEHHRVFNMDTAQVSHVHVNLKSDDEPKLESCALKCAALDIAQEPISQAEPSPAPGVTPEADTPEADTAEADRPEPDTPEADTPEPDTPEADILEEDIPEADTPEPDTPEPDTPEPVHISPEVQASAAQVQNPIDRLAERDTAPPRGDSELLRQDKPEPAFQQSECDHEAVSTTVEDSGVSSASVKHRDSTEQNGEQDSESLKDEPGPSSEGESNHRVLSPAKEPSSNTEHKPPPTNGKKQYSRDFLLSFQFKPACLRRPEGLPSMFDVVLDKMKRYRGPLLPEPQRHKSRSPDFTPNFRRASPDGKFAHPSNESLRWTPSSVNINKPVNDEVQLKRTENAWKRHSCQNRKAEEDTEEWKTKNLLYRLRAILNKLTPQRFNKLMKQVQELTIDTEERLKGVIDLVFEKAIEESHFVVGYGIMCKCLATIKVPMADKPNSTVNFRRLLLNRCQKEFEKDKTTNDAIETKRQELEAATSESERHMLNEELELEKCKFHRRTNGNVRFVGELFKLQMLTEDTMYKCLEKLLKNNTEGNLECFSILLTTIGKELDHDKAKQRMDLYFKQMTTIIKEKKSSSRVCYLLQDVIDMRQNNWVSRRVIQQPKTIMQIHLEAQLEMQAEQRNVLASMQSMGRKRPNQREPAPYSSSYQAQETTYSAPTNHVIDPSKIPKISKFTSDKTVYLGSCFGRGQLNWKSGCGGGETRYKGNQSDNLYPSCSRPSVSESSSMYVPNTPKPQPSTACGGTLERSQSINSEEEMVTCSKSIIKEFLCNKDYKVTLQCLKDLGKGAMMNVFVSMGVETTLERNQATRVHMGQLFLYLLQAGSLSRSQFFQGFLEVLEVADEMARDIPHLWLYIAELVEPVLHEGEISISQLFSEFSKPLLPMANAGNLFAEIMHRLCKQMGQTKVKALWRESGLSWADFLPETEDVNSFIKEQNLDFTLLKS